MTGMITGKSCKYLIVSFVVLGLIVGTYSCCQSLIKTQNNNSQIKPWPLYEDVRIIRFALVQYQSEHGGYPYDSRGEGFALFKLKQYMDPLPKVWPETVWRNGEVVLDWNTFYYRNQPPPIASGVSQNQGSSDTNVLFRVSIAGKGTLEIYETGAIAYREVHDSMGRN